MLVVRWAVEEAGAVVVEDGVEVEDHMVAKAAELALSSL